MKIERPSSKRLASRTSIDPGRTAGGRGLVGVVCDGVPGLVAGSQRAGAGPTTGTPPAVLTTP